MSRKHKKTGTFMGLDVMIDPMSLNEMTVAGRPIVIPQEFADFVTSLIKDNNTQAEELEKHAQARLASMRPAPPMEKVLPRLVPVPRATW